MAPTTTRMMPMVHRIEIFAMNPITSRMAPKTINWVLFPQGARYRAEVDLVCDWLPEDPDPKRAEWSDAVSVGVVVAPGGARRGTGRPSTADPAR